MTRAACDAGALTHLHEVGGLDLLNLFDELHVPDAVWTEAVREDRVPEAALHPLTNMKRPHPAPAAVEVFVERHHLELLHAGERACLYLPVPMPPPVTWPTPH